MVIGNKNATVSSSVLLASNIASKRLKSSKASMVSVMPFASIVTGKLTVKQSEPSRRLSTRPLFAEAPLMAFAKLESG